jgi:hypothetical protein
MKIISIALAACVLSLMGCSTAPKDAEVNTPPPVANPVAAATVTKTFYISVAGDKHLQEKIYASLQSKECFTLQDIDPQSAAPSECHAFGKYSAKAELGVNSYLYKVKAKAPVASKPGHFTLQGFESKNKKLVRTLNPGKFQIPSKLQIQSAEADYSEDQYVKDVAKNIVLLSFK